MRDEYEVIRKCPTCGTDTADLGLRDYSVWLNDLLPGRVGGSDVDCVLEQNATGRLLVLEFKEDTYIPRGQALLFDWFAHHGADVWVIRDRDFTEGKLEVSIYVPDQRAQVWRPCSVDEFRDMVRAWWELGE